MRDGAAHASGERGLPFLLAPEQSKERDRERKKTRYMPSSVLYLLYFFCCLCTHSGTPGIDIAALLGLCT